MSLWDDDPEGIGVSFFGLVICFLLFFLSLMTQSWEFFALTLLVFLASTWEAWFWWLPGVARRDRHEIRLDGAALRKLKTERPREWIVQGIRYFRDAGFFAADRDLGDEALADRIGLIDPTAPHADLLLLQHDAGRVWRGEIPEAPRGEDRVYERVLVEWGRISGGAFSPTEISELWEGEEGPVTVEFTHERRRELVEPEAGPLDLGLVGALNEIIEASGRQFVAVDLGGFGYVICLTPEARKQFVRDRGWWFC